MLKLILADLRANRWTLIWMSCLFVFVVGFAFWLGHQVAIINLLFALAIASSFCQVAGKYQADLLYCSLPVKRQQIVLSRYVWLLVTYGWVLLLAVGVAYFFKIFAFNGVVIPEPLVSTSYLLVPAVVMGFIFAMVLPFYFVWGYSRGLILGSIAMTGILALASTVFNVIIKANLAPEVWHSPLYNSNLSAFQHHILKGFYRGYIYFGNSRFLLITTSVVVVLLVFSVLVSIALYRRRDL